MNAALVILAAGMGSRYGGEKQTDGIGPGGEILMEYSIHDAIRAGFTKVVFIIKPEMLENMKRLCGDRIAKQVQVEYVFQDFTSIPDFYPVPAGRVKPFGTVHAVLCAAKAVQEPFVVINADDYYGVDAFKTIYDHLKTLPETGRAAMVAYCLKNTVSKNGSVTRGVCVGEKGTLQSVTETFNITLMPDGSIRDMSEGEGVALDENSAVSMNFWGFTPWFFEKLDTYFTDFLKALSPEELKKECLLPALEDELIKKGEMTVDMLRSDSRWFGMTYQPDRAAVQAELAALHADGVYPPTLHN
ncbi:MAG: hypothetical protein IJP23_00180 [Oscillospiraceae bacterium]|nr:hypothetical protein [Oscillospiraceae bacterium]